MHHSDKCTNGSNFGFISTRICLKVPHLQQGAAILPEQRESQIWNRTGELQRRAVHRGACRLQAPTIQANCPPARGTGGIASPDLY